MSKPSNAQQLEAMLFASGTPQTSTMIAKAFGWSETEVQDAAIDLQASLDGRGIQLVSGKDGFELAVASMVRTPVSQALKQSAQALSQSALEVLTIVAYRQPLAKTDIDDLRGVASDASLKTLLARDLIVSTGMKDGGIQYRTTNHFLHSLGLKKLEDLPATKGKLV